MSSEAFTFLALLLLALALLIFAFALVYNVGESARNKRRQQNEYHPPAPPPAGGAPSSSSSSAPRIRWGQVEDVDADEPSPAARGLVWGEDDASPAAAHGAVWGAEGLEPRGGEPAYRPIYVSSVPAEQEICPTCRRQFAATVGEPLARCANCGNYIHQECLHSPQGSNDKCPVCNGTQFNAA